MIGVKVILWLGVAVGVAGLGLTIYQTVLALPAQGEMHGANLTPVNFSLQTHFPGIIVMAIGAILLLTAAFLSRGSE